MRILKFAIYCFGFKRTPSEYLSHFQDYKLDTRIATGHCPGPSLQVLTLILKLAEAK